MSLTLYGHNTWTSPYVLSVFVALRAKGLAFEHLEIDLHAGDQHGAPFRDRSLTSRVPTLVDGDFALSESSAIVDYLEEKFAPPAYPRVLPEHVEQRARARQIMAWVRSDLMPIRLERATTYVFYPPAERPAMPPLSAEAEQAAKKLLFAADQFIPAGQTSLFGAWCVADTDLAMMLQRLVATGYDVPAKLRAFAEAQWRRPAVVEFVRRVRPPFVQPLP